MGVQDQKVAKNLHGTILGGKSIGLDQKNKES
jgi:hypothetical protein